jgi:branched-chain amino acid aminotransferase
VDSPGAYHQVGAYYKGGLTAIDGVVVEGFDRAAPSGVGHIKAAGNYAPDVLPSSQQKALGYPICLYLDAKENAYVEEFSTSNFLGVTKEGARS